MSFTKFDICTTASYLNGGEDIASFDDDTREARLCSRLYDTTKRNLLQSHPWVFAKKQQALAKTTEENIFTDYEYIFALPSDCLRVLKVETSPTRYNIIGNRIHSNVDPLNVLYIYEPEEADLPEYFVRCLEFAIAELLAASMAQDESLTSLMNSLKKEAIANAKLIDSQTKPPGTIDDSAFTLTRVR